MIKNYLTWPWIVSVPLLMCGFGCSVFFVGTDSVLLAPAILCLLGFVAISLYPNFRDGWAIPTTKSFIFIMLFWLWLFISNFWSSVPYVSTIFTIILSILPAFFAVCVLAPKAEEWTKVHVFALWLVLGSFGAWALVQFFFMYEQYGPRIHHPMLNPNNLSGLFNLGLFPALAMFFLSKEKRNLILSGIAVAIFYMALIVTQSRGGFFACVIAIGVMLPFILVKTQQPIPWKKLAFVAAVAFLLPFLGNIYNAGSLETNLVGAKMTNVESVHDRLYLWESTINMLKENPWFGTGLATFFFYYPRYRNPADRSDGFFSHMDPLQFGAETGVMATILFYAVLVCILLRTINAVKASGPDLKKRLEVIAPFCGMLALTGHTHITFHLYMPGMLLPLSGLLAYWYLATERALGDFGNRKEWKPQGKPRIATIGVFVLVLSLAGGWVSRTSSATYLMQDVQKTSREGRNEEAEKTLKIAGIVAPGSYGRYAEYEARFRISKLWQGAKDLPAEEAERIYKEAHEYLDEAESLNPAFTTLWDLRARLYYAMRDMPFVEEGEKRAIELLTEVVEKNPLAADSRVGLANIYKAKGEFKKAANVLEAGMKWPRQRGQVDINFLVALAQLKLQLGDKRAHDHYMAEATRRARSYGMIAQ